MNPKDIAGSRKPGISCVPANVMAEVGVALYEGALKYGRHNWRDAKSTLRASVYYDAAMRHLMAWWEGEDTDPDSNMSHITKVLSCLTVFRDAMMSEQWTDDRPPKSNMLIMKNDLQLLVNSLHAKYPVPVPPVTELPDVLLETETAGRIG